MDGSQSSSEKLFTVDRSVTGINSIGSDSIGADSNVITLTNAHDFINGESIRILSDTGQLPDGLEANTVYYAITAGLTTNRNIKVAKTLNDANTDNALKINNKGGVLSVVSRVSDKNSGEIGHPIQYDTTNNQWFIGVSTNCSSWSRLTQYCRTKSNNIRINGIISRISRNTNEPLSVCSVILNRVSYFT